MQRKKCQDGQASIQEDFKIENIEQIGKKCSSTSHQFRLTSKSKRNDSKPHAEKPFDLLKQIACKKQQKSALKAYNFVYNSQFKPLVDDPQTVNYIIDVMKQFNTSPPMEIKNIQGHRRNHTRLKSKDDRLSHREQSILTQTKSCLNSPRLSSNKANQQSKFDPERRNLWKLNDWVTLKMNEHKSCEKNSGTIITQRIHALHFAFSQACRQTGKYSQEIAKILINVHSQYHAMYESLVNCLMKQNLGLKKKIEHAQQKINSIILHYEQQLLNIRTEFDKKSAKVIQNFHKCIGMKQDLQNQNKILTKQLKNEKNKLGFMEEGLAKAIQILVQIGQNKFNFLSQEQNETILKLSSQIQNEPLNYRLFHKWCSTILKIISNMKEHSSVQTKKSKEKQKVQQNIRNLKKFALSSIGKYMIDYDPSLSINDAQTILLDFITHHKLYAPSVHESQIQVNLQQKIVNDQKDFTTKNVNEGLIDIYGLHQKIEKEKEQRPKSMHKNEHNGNFVVPNLFDISEKFKGVNVETQTMNINENEDKNIQTSLEMVSYGIMAKPKAVAKQTSTYNFLRSNMRIISISSMSEHIWAQKEQQQSKVSQGTIPAKKLKETVVRKMSVIAAISSLASPNSGRRASKKFQIAQIPDDEQKLKKPKKKQEENVKTDQQIKQGSLKIVSEIDEDKENEPKKTNTESLKTKQRQIIRKPKQAQKRVNFFLKKGQLLQAEEKNTLTVPNLTKSSNIVEVKAQLKDEKQLQLRKTQLALITSKLIGTSDHLSQEVKEIKERRMKNSKSWILHEKIQQSVDTNRGSQRLRILESRSLTFIGADQDDRGKDQLDKSLQSIIKKAIKKPNNNQQQKKEKIPSTSIKKIPKNQKLDIHGFHISISPGQGINKLANTKADDKYQAMVGLILEPKRNQKHQNQQLQQFSTHSRSFTTEMIELLQEKNRKITQSTMWNHKKNAQIGKFVHKLHLSKQKIMPTPGNLQVISNCLTNYVDPVIKTYIKLYSRVVQAQSILTNNQLKNQLLKGKKICYYHRLAPLLSILINVMSLSCFGVGKCTKYVTTFYRGIKSLKAMDRRYELYELLIDGDTIQMDVFAKIVYYLSENRELNLENQYVQLNLVELQLFFILDSYFTPGQISGLISDLQNSKKDPKQSPQQGINLQTLALHVLKSIAHKKSTLLKKYRHILQILTPDTISVSFINLVYFISIFPTDKKTRQKVLYQAALYLVYWDKKEGTIPVDRLLFLFEGFRFMSTEALEKNLIIQYFKIKCQSQFKQIYDKISRNPDYVVDSVYKLLYRVPQMLYRLTKQLKTSKESKNNMSILTVLYYMIIQDELEKMYMSGYLNAFTAIPIAL